MSIESLEDQMTEVHSNIDLSSNLSSAVSRTSEKLISRSSLLHNIQEHVKNLSLVIVFCEFLCNIVFLFTFQIIFVTQCHVFIFLYI